MSLPRTLEIVNASDVKPEKVDWLWHKWIPKGKLVILDGDPGCGKTTLALDIAAHLSTGTPLPGDTNGSIIKTLILNSEDGLNDTLRPRLDAAEAITDNIYFWNSNEDSPLFPKDLSWLEKIIIENSIGFVVIDPLMEFLDSGLNSNNYKDSKQALAAINKIPRTTGATILGIRHLTKGTGVSAQYRGMGSMAFSGTGRCTLIAHAHPTEKDVYVLARSKGNLSVEPTSLTYRIVEVDEQPVIEWTGSTHLVADDLVAEEIQPNAVDQASQFLTSVLADGPLTTELLHEKAEEQGISVASLRRAKKFVATITKKLDGINHTFLSAQVAQPARHPEVSTLSNLN